MTRSPTPHGNSRPSTDCGGMVGPAVWAQLRDQIINAPETSDFMAGVPIEAAHQRERWPSEHDAGKTPFDWFWLVGYLAQKAASAAVAGDTEKAKHHTISTAAALANWHAALTGKHTAMRPGIDPPADDWFCEPCQATNFGIRHVCRFCKQPRAAISKALGESTHD